MGKHVKPNEKRSAVPGKSSAASGQPYKRTESRTARSVRFGSFGFAGELGVVAAAFALALLLRYIPVTGWARVAAFVVPLAIAGYPAFIKAVDEAARLEFMKPDFIFSAAALAAMVLQECSEAVALLGAYRLCLLIQDFVENKFRRMAREFEESWPDTARVVRDGEETVCPIKDVAVGETVVVEPGETVPLDGLVIDGISSLRSEKLTGDGPVITAAPGHEIPSGSVNVTNTIRVRTIRDSFDSVAHRLRGMVDNSADDKTKRLFLLDKFGKVYTPVIVVLALIIAVVPPLVSGDWGRWLRCAVVFLIASQPIAVIFSVPRAYSGGVFGAANAGVFIKELDALELLSRTHTVVTEKTGIITDGEFLIEEVYTEGISEEELLNIAAAVERNIRHPIAEAICRAGDADTVAAEKVTDHSEVPGKGVSARVDGKLVLVGTASHLTDHNILYKVPNKPGAAIHVAIDGVYRGYFLISDRVRSKAFDALEGLRNQGVSSLVMLTGDVKSSARPVAASLNFDMVKFELSPAGKISAIEYLMATDPRRSALAFLGNGTDDGPALERADVGIAFDAISTYKAMDYADVIIMDSNIRKLPLAFRIARYTNSIAAQNITAFMAEKLLVLALALAGVGGLWLAIICEALLFAFTSANAARTVKQWV